MEEWRFQFQRCVISPPAPSIRRMSWTGKIAFKNSVPLLYYSPTTSITLFFFSRNYSLSHSESLRELLPWTPPAGLVLVMSVKTSGGGPAIQHADTHTCTNTKVGEQPHLSSRELLSGNLVSCFLGRINSINTLLNKGNTCEMSEPIASCQTFVACKCVYIHVCGYAKSSLPTGVFLTGLLTVWWHFKWGWYMRDTRQNPLPCPSFFFAVHTCTYTHTLKCTHRR